MSLKSGCLFQILPIDVSQLEPLKHAVPQDPAIPSPSIDLQKGERVTHAGAVPQGSMVSNVNMYWQHLLHLRST